MFRFEHPEFFWLMVVPLIVAGLFYGRRMLLLKAWANWGSPGSNTKVISASRFSPGHSWMAISGLVLITLSTVNPQWGFRKVAVDNKSANIYIVLDISNSMLAEDVAPNRLDRARRLALDLSTAFKTDKVGLILFAGNAYIQSPLTTDWHAIQLFLNSANPDQAGTQGTAIGEAIRLALKSNQHKESPEQGAFIILTDGEDHDSDAPAAVADAATAGWVTYIIGVGTEAGATIPIMIDGNKDLKRDENGQVVRTKLNEPLMKELVQKGNGRYFNLSDEKIIVEEMKKELATLARTQLEKRSFSEHRSYYQWFLLPGLLLLIGFVGLNFKFDVV
ncbi:MAG TPA: VWA domain-containing protein [Saprospiraceae bacterium]|nr:VWA domain-containing protein [Saprospiraceae bacterium]